MVDPAKIIRYLKVEALAIAGADGEREAARATLQRLEERNPELREAVEAYKRLQAAEKRQGQNTHPHAHRPERDRGPRPNPNWQSEPPPGDWVDGGATGAAGAGAPWLRGRSWDDIFRVAQGVAETAYEFTSRVTDAYTGAQLAQQAEGYAKHTRQGNVVFGVKLPVEVVERAFFLNDMQKATFRRELHRVLDREIDKLLGEE